eukprot:scaffold3103_cov136-Cylindrotheca_fusiformis.AAC.7
MAHGEVEVTSSLPVAGAEDEENEEQQQQQQATTSTNRRERMNNLSFAQRRHELAWRIMSHSRAMTHVAALTAAAASADLGPATQVSTRALQHARTAWVQADEAQDALYFFHAQLFPSRKSPHDVYGALDLLLGGAAWPDMPQDMQLRVDRYESSREKAWSANETAERWHMAVREKLLLGEMGWMKQNTEERVPWKISLRGGVVRLTHGTPKTIVSDGKNKTMYPIEAILTVLTTSQPAEWTLVSVEVHAQAKTGQSNHQLDTTNRQRFDLHRLCALAMAREEARARQLQEKSSTEEESNTRPARPLHVLFQVAQVFGLSWQLEILSAQAQALRKGVWGSSSSSIVVTPVQFFENRSILGIVSISFWSIDDRYGPPCMGDLNREDDEDGESDIPNGKHHSSSDSMSTVSRSINTPSVTNQLTLSVRAKANVGIRVSLSGAETIMDFASAQPHTRQTIRQLLEATSNPFCLSASEALLAATRLCAERKCHAIAQVLPSFLPSWISLSPDRGSIVVAATIQYHGITPSKSKKPVVLFRLVCDARTGSFSCVFSRSTQLLRFMACNDPKAANDTTALRIANLADHRRTSRAMGASFASGRVVRDAFDGLIRSVNVLGQRTGVGGSWNDNDDLSASLRLRAIHIACKDVKVSLATSCGMAAMYGLSALALGVATGVAANPDTAGGALEASRDGIRFLPAPPLSLLIDQQFVETTERTSDGDKTQTIYTEQELFGTCCSVDDLALTMYGLKVNVKLDTPSSVPSRKSWELRTLHSGPQRIPLDTEEAPPAKKARTESADGRSAPQELMAEVEVFASIISHTLDLES